MSLANTNLDPEVGNRGGGVEGQRRGGRQRLRVVSQASGAEEGWGVGRG